MGTIMTTDLELETLIGLLEEGGRSESRGLRLTSYTGLYKSKDARLAILKQLYRLRDLDEGDYLGEDQ